MKTAFQPRWASPLLDIHTVTCYHNPSHDQPDTKDRFLQPSSAPSGSHPLLCLCTFLPLLPPAPVFSVCLSPPSVQGQAVFTCEPQNLVRCLACSLDIKWWPTDCGVTPALLLGRRHEISFIPLCFVQSLGGVLNSSLNWMMGNRKVNKWKSKGIEKNTFKNSVREDS